MLSLVNQEEFQSEWFSFYVQFEEGHNSRLVPERSTVALALGQQKALTYLTTSLASILSHMAFPVIAIPMTHGSFCPLN